MTQKEFSRWLRESEKEIEPEFNRRLINGVIIPENLDSELLQHYISYRINKSNQQLVKVTWILALISLAGLIVSLLIRF